MQFRDLVKQYNVLKPAIDKAMTDTAASGGYIMGKPVKELESSWQSMSVPNTVLHVRMGQML